MKRLEENYFTIATLIAIGLALVPSLLLLFFGGTPLTAVLVSVGCLGWLTVGVLLVHEEVVYSAVRKALAVIGLPEPDANTTDLIHYFTRESVRYHKVAFFSRSQASQSGAVTLGQNLERVTQAVFSELGAASVELSLFDSSLGHWSRNLLIGNPRFPDSQSLLTGDVEAALFEEETEPTEMAVKRIVRRLQFASTVFGIIRIEFRQPKLLEKADWQVLQLLLSEGALLLVDARFTDELLRMRKAGEESNRTKTGFLANLSHEIRGPLGTIINGVELALDGLCGDLSPAMRESLRMIKNSGDHLLDLVNDVLDYARVEAGKIAVTPIELPLRPLLEDLVAVVRSQATAKEHELKLLHVPEFLGVVCDKRHVRQIVINFLTNAIKYTPHGGKIEVSAELLAHGRVEISVRDNGIGIEQQEQDKVFGAFERVNDSYALAQGGTGLGMPLSRRLAEVNNGSVGFESEKDKGSVFWVTLPFCEVEEVESCDEADQDTVVVEGRGEKVLIVDHDEANRRMLGRYLDCQGFQAIAVGSASEMLKALRLGGIQLAIIENAFSDLPGEEVVATLRGIPNGATIPVILISSSAFTFDIERFLKLGVDRCLAKPVPLRELAHTVRRLIDELRQLEASLAPQ